MQGRSWPPAFPHRLVRTKRRTNVLLETIEVRIHHDIALFTARVANGVGTRANHGCRVVDRIQKIWQGDPGISRVELPRANGIGDEHRRYNPDARQVRWISDHFEILVGHLLDRFKS